MAKKKSKKKKKSSVGRGGGLKGFGSTTTTTSTSTTAASNVEIDRSKPAMQFYNYIENNGGAKNLKRVALGYFPLDDTNKIRGVIATKDIPKGDVIIDIPYEMALNLGKESSDPTLPAVQLLDLYCRYLNDDDEGGAYLAMLPPFMGSDCLGSTDFWSDDILEMMQYPPVMEETLGRRTKTLDRFRSDIEPMGWKWSHHDDEVEEIHLRWATWLITSRVLTVQGAASPPANDDDEFTPTSSSPEAFRLMIPLIDMCNHDRQSVHVLTGRAVPGGNLKILAGCDVKVGDQITICYGGGVEGNDRFIQDYGFLDQFGQKKDVAFDMVADKILGKRRGGLRGVSGAAAGFLNAEMRERTLDALGRTTVEQDLEALGEIDDAREDSFQVRSAIEFRLGVKKALERSSA